MIREIFWRCIKINDETQNIYNQGSGLLYIYILLFISFVFFLYIIYIFCFMLYYIYIIFYIYHILYISYFIYSWPAFGGPKNLVYIYIYTHGRASVEKCMLNIFRTTPTAQSACSPYHSNPTPHTPCDSPNAFMPHTGSTALWRACDGYDGAS